ncbi:MAG: ROK family protein [Acidobacteriota bacterium]
MKTEGTRHSQVLGIDIGGSGIKGAPVDTERGVLLAERLHIPTPQPAKPEAVADVVAELVQHFAWSGPVGCAFPAVIKSGVTATAANIDERWIGFDAQSLFEHRTGCSVSLCNDADAAGVAEMLFGAGRGQQGLVIMLTLGTGIGSAIFIGGRLVPNTELGHLMIRGKKAEHRASARVRTEQNWSWQQWAARLDEVMCCIDSLLNPDLFILGGGVSKEHASFLHHLKIQVPLLPAELRNDAGIVGAALAEGGLSRQIEAASLMPVATVP